MSLIARTTTGVNLRSSPGGTKLGTLQKGKEVEVLGFQGEWLQVRSGATVGFASAPYLRPVSGTLPLQVTAKGLNLRASASGSAAVKAVLPRGTIVGMTDWSGDWIGVASPEGQGFVSAAFVGPLAAPAPEPTAVDTTGRLPSPAAVRERRKEIAEIADPTARADAYEALHRLSPYYNQRDNEATDHGVRIEVPTGAMCNLTTLAMVLSYLGIDNPSPPAQYEDALEALRQERGLPPRTYTTGWGGVAQLLGVGPRIIAGAAVQKRDWWTNTVRPRLREGSGVMMSISGHIVRLVGVAAEGLVIDDPYGWSTLLAGEKHGWNATNPREATTETVGRAILYPWADVEIHTMRWVAVLPEPTGLESFGPDDLPEFRDEEPSFVGDDPEDGEG